MSGGLYCLVVSCALSLNLLVSNVFVFEFHYKNCCLKLFMFYCFKYIEVIDSRML
jgi:hypothetical protein